MYKYYGQTGVTLCAEWHDFQMFAEWFNSNYKEGQCIDKDLTGSKEYSPTSCVFLPSDLNKMLVLRSTKSGYAGVRKSWEGKYHVRYVDVRGNRKILTGFTDPKTACNMYLEKRKELLVHKARLSLMEGEISSEIFKLVEDFDYNKILGEVNECI